MEKAKTEAVEEAKEKEAKADKRLKDLQAKVKQLQDDGPRQEQQMANARQEA